MYKKRLKKWNIRKRIYRKAQNSTPTSVTPSMPSSGPSLSISQVDDHEDPDVEEVARSPGVSERTAMPAQPSALEPYIALEIILGSVFSWTQGKIETHGFISDPMSKYLVHPDKAPIQDSRTIYRTFKLVFDL